MAAVKFAAIAALVLFGVIAVALWVLGEER
jgi:hypothetical protein